MPFGFHGKIAHINLTDGAITIENPPEAFYRRYLGGWNVVAHYLLKEVKPNTDPLGPDNVLVFAPGVVSGVPFSGNSRYSVGAKSPLTGAFGQGDCAGFWASEFKRAGLDGLVIKGKADQPVYLWIKDGEIEIRDAAHLWGMLAKETEAAIREELGDRRIRVALIGPAGEKLSRVSCVMNDLKDAAGRTGMGAVMGSKNLKAVACRGAQAVPVANPEKVRELAKWMADNVMKLSGGMHDFGTGREMDAGAASGNLPTHNFRDAGLENVLNIDARTMATTIRADAVSGGKEPGMEACWACAVRCKKVMRNDTPPYIVDPAYGGPEYETNAALGSNCGVTDALAVTYANQVCNAYTLDTIGAGMCASFAMECFEAGIITTADTGGVDWSFGNAAGMVDIIEKLAKREGIGDLLAEGTARAARKLGKGSEQFVLTVKDQEFPMHEPRLKRALGLGYMVSPTGADHCHNLHDMGLTSEAGIGGAKMYGIYEPIPLADLSYKKVRALAYTTMNSIFSNCAVFCSFVPWTNDQKVEWVRAITGWNYSMFELMEAGRRGLTMARAFNTREGFTPADDVLPPRMANPQTSGALANTPADLMALDKAKHIYYGIMGWDEQTGVPTKSTLMGLDVAWVADVMNER